MTINTLTFANQFSQLGDEFFVRTIPEKVKAPRLISFNNDLANQLGLSENTFDNVEAAAIFSGNLIPDGADPVAMAYSGHQFGHFNPQLGDGRAILLGEIKDRDGKSNNVQLKGSGRTFFSRNGDGRAALGPVLREYLLSEAMFKLGVPTTRALAAVSTGEQVFREQPLPGAVITRVASSFVRVGSFEYFAARCNVAAIKKLADYVIEQNYSELEGVVDRYAKLLSSIISRQAVLIAQWMNLGFIHGVMNTDNMSVAGETIDYGPCAFMDYFDFDQVYSSIDRNGRYAYNNQPEIALWNLTRLAETLLPLLSQESEQAIEIAKGQLSRFNALYQQSRLDGLRKKLGLLDERKEDQALCDKLFAIMADSGADFTLTFYFLSHLLSDASEIDENSLEQLYALFKKPERITEWVKNWHEYVGSSECPAAMIRQTMLAVNPVYIPRNHLVEAVIRAAEDKGEFSLFHELHDVLQRPYQLQPGRDHFMQPPQPEEVVTQTFCGT